MDAEPPPPPRKRTVALDSVALPSALEELSPQIVRRTRGTRRRRYGYNNEKGTADHYQTARPKQLLNILFHNREHMRTRPNHSKAALHGVAIQREIITGSSPSSSFSCRTLDERKSSFNNRAIAKRENAAGI